MWCVIMCLLSALWKSTMRWPPCQWLWNPILLHVVSTQRFEQVKKNIPEISDLYPLHLQIPRRLDSACKSNIRWASAWGAGCCRLHSRWWWSAAWHEGEWWASGGWVVSVEWEKSVVWEWCRWWWGSRVKRQMWDGVSWESSGKHENCQNVSWM